MTLPLTPEILEAAYTFLLACPPFNRWKLPPGDQVKFRITHQPIYGQCYHDGRGPCVDVSARKNGYTATVLETVGHEMIHLHLDRNGDRAAKQSEHGAGFRRCAARVCKIHGFDPRRF